MADPIVPQVPPAGDPQTPLTTPPGEPAAPQTIDEYKAELAKARDALTAANHEAADRRKKLKAFEDAETKRLAEEQKKKDADLSEVERLKKLHDEKEKALTEYQVQLLGERSRNAFERVVRVKHVEFQSDKAEEDAFAVFAASVEFDDEGKPKEPDKALEALLKERPYLVKAERAPLAPNLNAGPNNGKGKVDEEARKKELAQRFRIRV